MAVATIVTEPIGSIWAPTIGNDDPADQNDFTCYIVWDTNVTGLTQNNLTLSKGSIQSFTGENSVYAVVIRPVVPTTPSSETITLTIAANSVTEGNVVTTKTIRISRWFPDADAENASVLFTPTESPYKHGMTVTPTRIVLSARNPNRLFFYTHAGVEQTAENRTIRSGGRIGNLDFLNGDFLATSWDSFTADPNLTYRTSFFGGQETNRYLGQLFRSVTHTRYGILGYVSTSGSRGYRHIGFPQIDPQAALPTVVSVTDDFGAQNTLVSGSTVEVATDLFIAKIDNTQDVVLADLVSESELRQITRLNFRLAQGRLLTEISDLAFYQDTLFIFNGSLRRVETLDFKKYRPLAKRTKTTIYPQFIKNGERLDLTEVAPDAERIIFDVGFSKPSWLSINASNELVVAANATIDEQPVLVKCRAINRIDSAPFSFYLIIKANTAPVWRDISDLTMKANGTYNLYQLLSVGATVAFKVGETQPAGVTLTDGQLHVGTVSGTVSLTATLNGLTTDKNLTIDIVQDTATANFSDVFRYSIEIRGIAIPAADVIQSGRNPQINKSLDSIQLTRYRAHSVTIDLVDEDGKYNPDIPNNFWDSNAMHPGGYQEPIKVFLENYVNNAWVKTLMFVGIIEDEVEVISNVQARLTANDISVSLEREHVSNFGTLEKWNSLRRRQSDEASY